MINFSEDYHEYGTSKTQQELGEIIDKFLQNPYEENISYGGLHPQEIQDIIAFLMYQEGNKIIALTIGLESDGYHLSLRVDKKVKSDLFK